MMIFYTGGLYLILSGVLLFLNDADIFVGFLWVIDFGVGLIFFIFILHYSSFLHQKTNLSINLRIYLLSLLIVSSLVLWNYFNPYNHNSDHFNSLSKLWFFKIVYIDYYLISNSKEITDLNLIYELYFTTNTFEFFAINFTLFYGLIASILLCFAIHRFFSYLNSSQIINSSLLNTLNNNFFIRNQNMIRQKNTQAVVRVWNKVYKK